MEPFNHHTAHRHGEFICQSLHDPYHAEVLIINGLELFSIQFYRLKPFEFALAGIDFSSTKLGAEEHKT